MKRATLWAAAAVFAAACAGCAQQAIILRPGPISPPAAAGGSGSPWSLWVAEARDVRQEGQTGSKVGTFYTRFSKTPQIGYLDPNPEVYVKYQLSRYLFARGWEASGPETAKGLLRLNVEEFSMQEDPGSVWDTTKVRVAYSVAISDRAGQELGRVRLEGGAETKSPFDTKRQVEGAFRDAVADTLEALSRSEAFQKAVGQLPP
jgi:hypothetical protein